MKQVVVSQGQSLVDVCLQELGSTAALFDLADANGISITHELQPGQQLSVPESLLSVPALAGYYAASGYRVNVPDPQGTASRPPVQPAGLHDFLAADVLRPDVY